MASINWDHYVNEKKASDHLTKLIYRLSINPITRPALGNLAVADVITDGNLIPPQELPPPNDPDILEFIFLPNAPETAEEIANRLGEYNRDRERPIPLDRIVLNIGGAVVFYENFDEMENMNHTPSYRRINTRTNTQVIDEMFAVQFLDLKKEQVDWVVTSESVRDLINSYGYTREQATNLVRKLIGRYASKDYDFLKNQDIEHMFSYLRKLTFTPDRKYYYKIKIMSVVRKLHQPLQQVMAQIEAYAEMIYGPNDAFREYFLNRVMLQALVAFTADNISQALIKYLDSKMERNIQVDWKEQLKLVIEREYDNENKPQMELQFNRVTNQVYKNAFQCNNITSSIHKDMYDPYELVLKYNFLFETPPNLGPNKIFAPEYPLPPIPYNPPPNLQPPLRPNISPLQPPLPPPPNPERHQPPTQPYAQSPLFPVRFVPGLRLRFVTTARTAILFWRHLLSQLGPLRLHIHHKGRRDIRMEFHHHFMLP